MFVKSLAIFIVVGVAAGLAFGMYLADVRHSGQLTYTEGPSLSVLAKPDLKKGEQITIRIVNSGTQPLTFADSSYGLRITGLSGIMIYEPEHTETAARLEPRQEAEFVWDQIRADGDQALEGLYKIHAEGTDPQGNTIRESATITIWK